MRTKDFTDQKLIHSLNRGGLYAVPPECQALFHRAEEHFRIETDNSFTDERQGRNKHLQLYSRKLF